MRFILALIGRLPEGIAYGLARLLYLLLFHVFRYRRAVVQDNLAHAFPNASPAALREMERNAYRHLCNLAVEVLRAPYLPRAFFDERVTLRNPELLKDATDNYERQAIILLIHQGNWEWLLHGAMAQLPISVDPVYKSLHSEFWNDYMLRARSRFGATPMTIETIGREVIRGRRKKRIIVMLADQAGPKHGGYWTRFLHRPAVFFRGADKLAQALELPVLFARCHTPSRGHYEVEFQPLSLPPHEQSDAILPAYVAAAEAAIRDDPARYLWTNRRWKKVPPEGVVVANGDHHPDIDDPIQVNQPSSRL